MHVAIAPHRRKVTMRRNEAEVELVPSVVARRRRAALAKARRRSWRGPHDTPPAKRSTPLFVGGFTCGFQIPVRAARFDKFGIGSYRYRYWHGVCVMLKRVILPLDPNS